MTEDQIVDEAKNYLIGRDLLARGYIMGVETSTDNSLFGFDVDIRIRWNVNQEQYEKLIQKIQSQDLSVLLMDGGV